MTDPVKNEDAMVAFTTVATSKEFLDHKKETRKLEMGWAGQLFGWATEKPGNIAGISIVSSLIMIAILAIFPPSDPRVPLSELFTLFGGIITLALGFLFGRSDRD